MQENYGSVLKDCSRAITINPESSKAYYRSASALVALERLEEALDCCDRCLAFDGENVNVRDLRKTAAKRKEAKEQKEAEKREQERGKQEQARKLRIAFQVSLVCRYYLYCADNEQLRNEISSRCQTLTAPRTTHIPLISTGKIHQGKPSSYLRSSYIRNTPRPTSSLTS